ncbi:MAG: hypothetical protein IJI14_08685 [Anaerolineaceae bacterium]|nr:hypothetical protein [Anaerolineaceae bacterium]
MVIFASEKDYRSWKHQRGVEHDKDRVSYRKADGSKFFGPRNAWSFKPRERDWGYPDEVEKILKKDFGWRSDIYERCGSVQDDTDLRNEYLSEIEYENWQKEQLRLMEERESEEKRRIEEEAEMWRKMYPVDHFFADMNDLSEEIDPFFLPVFDAKMNKVFVFVTNADEMKYLEIIKKYENYGFKTYLMPESFALGVVVALP